MTTDAFARVADALRTSWRAQGEAWDATSARTRNLMLDECGSDHRAIVDLLVNAGDDVRAALASSTTSPSWDVRRAPIVHRLVATRFLQTDVARWMVDAWAFAIGVTTQLPQSPSMQQISQQVAQQQVQRAAERRMDVNAQAAAFLAPYTGGAYTGGAGTHGVPSGTMPAGSGSRSSFFFRKTNAGAATQGRWSANAARRSPMTPAELARIKRMERIGAWMLTAAVVLGFAAQGYAMLSRKFSAPPVAAADTVPRGGAGVSRTQDIVANASYAPRVDAQLSATPAAVSSIAMGSAWIGPVAGRYRVTHRTMSVDGSAGCEDVAAALSQQQESIEVVEQEAGSSVVRLASRGISGHVEPDGRFFTGPDSGITDGVHWTFTMQGRFTATGFTAQSQKFTDALMRWHVSRTCAVVAELTGTRLSSVAPGASSR